MQITKQTDRKTKEDDLTNAGKDIEKQREDEHNKRKAELQKKIDEMTKALDLKIAQNKDEEAKLTAAFEQADKGYSEALESYDTDLMTQNTELNNL